MNYSFKEAESAAPVFTALIAGLARIVFGE
jgi:hypothetical protein